MFNVLVYVKVSVRVDLSILLLKYSIFVSVQGHTCIYGRKSICDKMGGLDGSGNWSNR